MSKENPYDKFLDGRPVEEILAATANRIAEDLEVMGHQKATVEQAPGKWSAAGIVSHLADCEIVFGFRLRQTLAEHEPTIQPFDQDKWAREGQYARIPANLALEVFSALRKWNLQLIKSVMATAGDRKMTHPERGTMTFRNVVETMAGHDLNHLEQLKKIVQKPA
jgi:hypothetical protein